MAVLWRHWKRRKQKAMRQEGQPSYATHADRGEAVTFPQQNVTRSESGHIYLASAQLDSSQTHLDDIHLKDSWMTMLQENTSADFGESNWSELPADLDTTDISK